MRRPLKLKHISIEDWNALPEDRQLVLCVEAGIQVIPPTTQKTKAQQWLEKFNAVYKAMLRDESELNEFGHFIFDDDSRLDLIEYAAYKSKPGTYDALLETRIASLRKYAADRGLQILKDNHEG